MMSNVKLVHFVCRVGGGLYLKCFKIHEVETKDKNKNIRDWYNSKMNKKGYQPHTNLVKNEYFE